MFGLDLRFCQGIILSNFARIFEAIFNLLGEVAFKATSKIIFFFKLILTCTLESSR